MYAFTCAICGKISMLFLLLLFIEASMTLDCSHYLILVPFLLIKKWYFWDIKVLKNGCLSIGPQLFFSFILFLILIMMKHKNDHCDLTHEADLFCCCFCQCCFEVSSVLFHIFCCSQICSVRKLARFDLRGGGQFRCW